MRLLAAMFISVLAQAADPVVHPLSLIVGKGELLQFSQDVVKVVIAEPKIADAIIVSPRDVMVNAKGMGHTTLLIWETGAAPAQYDVSVQSDTTELDNLYKALGAELKSGLPEAAIEFSGNAETMVLTGKVANAGEAKRAEAIASTHTKKVLNMIEAPKAELRQILLQVKFDDVDRTALNQFGFNFFSNNPKAIGNSSTNQFQAPLFSQLQFQGEQFGNTNVNLANLLNLFLFNPALNIGATVQAMEQQNVAQILAEPNLIVVEGSEGSFLAGGEFPFPTIVATPTGAGIAPVVTVQFKKFGVQLNFTPTITAEGAINLKVKPEVQRALDFTNAVTLEGFLIPALSSRVAETEVVLKDGQSFAIAGLIDNRVTQVMNKIPVLGDIPILGNLFRSHSTQKSTDELMVVITARLVKPLAPGDQAKLPDTVIPFLPSVAEQKAAKEKKKKNDKKPEFVGPRGSQEPNQQ